MLCPELEIRELRDNHRHGIVEIYSSDTATLKHTCLLHQSGMEDDDHLKTSVCSWN